MGIAGICRCNPTGFPSLENKLGSCSTQMSDTSKWILDLRPYCLSLKPDAYQSKRDIVKCGVGLTLLISFELGGKGQWNGIYNIQDHYKNRSNNFVKYITLTKRSGALEKNRITGANIGLYLVGQLLLPLLLYSTRLQLLWRDGWATGITSLSYVTTASPHYKNALPPQPQPVVQGMSSGLACTE